MKEIEVKFFIPDKDSFRQKILSLGAIKISDEFLMKRVIYENPSTPKGDWIRIRQEANKVTLTFKSNQGLYLGGMNEIEVTVSDFEKTNAIITQTGLQKVAQQENYREVWNLNNTEVVIDTWPWLPPYVEIEGRNEEFVKDSAILLGFDINKEGVFGTVVNLYQKIYAITSDQFHQIKDIRFDNPKPENFQTL